MPAAGETIIAGRVPGERIATDIDTADSAGVTLTETVVQTVTAPLVAGRTYRIRWATGINTSVAGDTAFTRIREDSLTGTQLQLHRVYLGFTGGGGSRIPAEPEAEYTAVSTGDKTFACTLIRVSGNGTIVRQASANFPSYLYVDYIRG